MRIFSGDSDPSGTKSVMVLGATATLSTRNPRAGVPTRVASTGTEANENCFATIRASLGDIFVAEKEEFVKDLSPLVNLEDRKKLKSLFDYVKEYLVKNIS